MNFEHKQIYKVSQSYEFESNLCFEKIEDTFVLVTCLFLFDGFDEISFTQSDLRVFREIFFRAPFRVEIKIIYSLASA